MGKLIAIVAVLVFVLAWMVEGLIVASIITTAYAWGARQVSRWRG